MSSYNRITTIVGNKDIALRAAGQKIDLCTTGNCPGGCKFNAVPGEILIIDLEKRETIAVAQIATVKKLGIAQALGDNGCVSDLKFLFHQDFNLCDHKFGVNVASPKCGQGQIVDVWLPNCTATDSTVGFGIELDDSIVRATNGYNEKLLYNWVVDNYKAGCKTCDETAVCDELVCQLVDKINGTFQPDPMKVSHHGFTNDMCNKYQPFRAARLYPGTGTAKNFNLTLSPTSGCDTCIYVPAIKGIKINDVATNFTYTVDPTDNTKSLVAQIDRIVDLINEALKPIGGYAYRMKGLGKCCDYKIQINTCATVKLIGASADIDPTSVENIAASQDADVICRDCGDTPAPETLTCGLRIFVDTVDVPCNCAYPDSVPGPNTYIRTIKPMLLADDNSTGSLYVVEKQAPERPEGFGYYYQQLQRRESTGGPGRDKRYTNAYFGESLILPDAGSRDSNIDVQCDSTYCVYDFDINHSAIGKHNNALGYHNRDRGIVLIKKSNTTLKDDWEEILTALQSRGLCTTINVTCE